MRTYCAVYVDAGYLLAAVATRVSGTSLRGSVDIDLPGLIQALMSQAETTSGLELLRLNWYDAGSARGGNPDATQEHIGMLPRVKLRLGRISPNGEQKGVDLRLGLDLVTHSRHRVADVFYVVTGDDDLTEAVEEAQGHGIQVVILAVPDAHGRPIAVSRHLQREADGIITVDPDALASYARAAMPAEAVAGCGPESGATGPSPVAAAVAAMAGAPIRPAPPSPPTPKDLPSRRPEPSPAVLAAQNAARARMAADDAARARAEAESQRVFTSQTGAPSSAGPAAELEQTVEHVVRRVVTAWLQSADPSARVALRAERPYIPRDIDRALLIDLSGALGVYDIEDHTRYLLRDQFWPVVEELLGGFR
jgi:uncharacterized LabA/DUF88 family protein